MRYSAAPAFNLSPEQAEHMVSSMIDVVRQWRMHFAAVGFGGPLLDQLAPSFAICGDHCA